MLYLTNRPLTEDLRTRLRAQKKSTSVFKATWSATLSLLAKEVWYLAHAERAVLMIDVDERMIRNDGQVRADARPYSPNVAIAVETPKHGSLIFPGGAFTDWQDNVRAIALGMEALRKVDRYGISPSGEQYRGWRAIGSGVAMDAGRGLTVDRAWEILGVPEGTVRNNLVAAERAYKELAKIHHPDRGGNAAQMKDVTEAWALLRKVLG